MNIAVELLDGYLPDAYGKYADEADKTGWSCRRSFPFTVEELPEGTAAVAFIFYDWDSVPVCGFPWIHWCAYVNGPLDGALAVADDASRTGADGIVQGYNSAQKSEPARGFGYVGPCPPDCDHVYTIAAVALDAPLSLEAPFWANELVAACRGHELARAEMLLPSRS